MYVNLTSDVMWKRLRERESNRTSIAIVTRDMWRRFVSSLVSTLLLILYDGKKNNMI